MTRRRHEKPEEPKVTRVSLVDRVSGTHVTVGSNVAEKFLKDSRKRWRRYDPAKDDRRDDELSFAHGEDPNYDPTADDPDLADDETDGDGSEEPPLPPAKTPTPVKK